MNRKLIALATAIAMSVAAMTSSVFAIDETEKTTELQASSSISTGTIGNISTEEVDLEQQRIIFQREQEFRANLEKAASAEASRVVNPPNSEENRTTYPEAPDLAKLVVELNAASRSSVLGTASTYSLVTLYQSATETKQAIVDNLGRSVTGWESDDTGWRYKVGNTYVTGLYPMGSEYYYFTTSGYMVHGWQELTSSDLPNGWYAGYYYFGVPGDEDSGALYDYGWLSDTEADGSWYYLDPDENGRMYHGLLYDDGEYYYLGMPGDDDSGAMYTYGWLKDTEQSGDPWYYFDTDGVAYADDWEVIDGETYYFRTNGQMIESDWLVDGGYRYYFDTSGAMVSGNVFRYIDNERYYFTNTGPVKTKWFEVSGQIYNANLAGALSRGVTQMSEYHYSNFDASGVYLESDTLISRTPKPIFEDDGSPKVENGIAATYIPSNVRCASLDISNGHCRANIIIGGSYFESKNPGVISNVANYFNNNSAGRVKVTYSTNDAEINVRVDEYIGFTNNTTVAVTYTRDAQDRWLNGVSAPGVYEASSSEIIAVSSIIYFNPSCTSENDFTETDYINTLRHELGHAVGLRHTYEPFYNETDPGDIALMYPDCSDTVHFSATFCDYDYDELRKIYPDYPWEEL